MSRFFAVVLLVFVICAGGSTVRAQHTTVVEQVLRQENAAEGFSQAYLAEKMTEIAIRHIRAHIKDATVADAYVKNIQNIIAGYTIRKIDETEGTFLLKVNLSLPEVPRQTATRTVSVICRDTRRFDHVRMINAALEHATERQLLPVYISAAESRWDFITGMSPVELYGSIAELLGNFTVAAAGDRLFIHPDTP